jgi:WD40 repeat protein
MLNELHTTTSKYHPCSIERFPSRKIESSLFEKDIAFICGLYELDDEKSIRKGGIEFYSHNCEVKHRIEVDGGVLDMKCSGNYDYLACALSSSSVKFLKLKGNYNDSRSSEFIWNIPDQGLILSLCWNDTIHSPSPIPLQQPNIVVSTQESALFVGAFNESGVDIIYSVHDAHQLHGENVPAWISIFDPHSKTTILSGGDDCSMKLWDIRADPTSPIISNKKTHQAGVTSAQWHPFSPHIFCTGSYDAHVRIWDDRSCRQPLHDIEAGGLPSPNLLCLNMSNSNKAYE